MKPGSIETFTHYSHFASLSDFNENMDAFLSAHHDLFTKGELVAFKRLVRYCAKVPGVANAKIATVVKACIEQGGVSRSTLERMLRKAKGTGILTTHHTVRRRGGYSHNVYVFQRYDVAEEEKLTEREMERTPPPATGSTAAERKETIQYIKTQEKKKNRWETDLDHSYTDNRIPKAFRNLVKSYFDSAEKIEGYFRRLQQAARLTKFDDEPGTVLEIGMNSFKQLIPMMKKGKVRNPYAYYYRICVNAFDDWISEVVAGWGQDRREAREVREEFWRELGLGSYVS